MSEIAQELDLLPGRRLLVVLIVTLIVTVVSVLISGWMLVAWMGGIAGPQPPEAAETAPAPEEISGVRTTLVEEVRAGQALMEAQRELLTRYAWVDEDAGIVRPPIERAMEMVVEEEGAR